MSRESQTDNRKHGPATTKADVSMPAQYPYCMGDWVAPGVTIVTDDDPDNDAYYAYKPGPVTSDPLPQ